MKRYRNVLVTALVATAVLAVAAGRTTTTASTSLGRTETLGPMTVDRAGHQATMLVSGEVLITGGCGANGCESVHASTELFDPTENAFRPAATMHTARVSHVASILPDGRVLVAGGWTGESATADAEVYDPARRTFKRIAAMSSPRMTASAVRLLDGRIVITGGETEVGAAIDSIEVFDPVTNRFLTPGRMTVPRSRHVSVLLPDGRVLITGGHRARRQVVRSAEILDPESFESHPTGEMDSPRHKHAAVVLPDGRALIIGGSHEGGTGDGRYDTTEIYDPRTGTFTRGPMLKSRRHKIPDAVAVLPGSGATLVAGGAGSFEAWMPGFAAFEVIKRDARNRAEFATLTTLRDGRVLMLGGYDEGVRPSASAWLFVPHAE